MLKEQENLLKWYKEMGVDDHLTNKHLKISSVEKPRKNNKEVKLEEDIISKDKNSMASITREICNKITSLEELKTVVLNFKDMPIAIMATNPVFADGNRNASVMIIGEAPGANEDATGVPFCGQSGKLLDKIFAFIGLSRTNNLYITNSVFWRPPGNRRPTIEESMICLPFLEKHIELINPKLIIAVGSTSAQAILGSNLAISELRSQFHAYTNQYLNKEIPVAVIFHPSYLLRQPSQKKVVWFDLLKIKKRFLS